MSTYEHGATGRSSDSRNARLRPRADRLSAVDAPGLRLRLELARANAEAGRPLEAEKALPGILADIDRLRSSSPSRAPDNELSLVEASALSLQAQLSEASHPSVVQEGTPLSRAVGVFNIITGAGEVNARAWADYGAAQDILGLKADAEVSLREALRRGDTSRSTSHRLARILLRTNRAEEAEQILRQVLARDTPKPTTLRLLGDSLSGRRGAEAAEAYVTAARMLLSADQLEGAVEVARLAVELAPSNFEAWLVLGDGVRLLGQNDEALQALDQALALFPAHPQALAARADLLRIVGDYAGALADLDALLEQSPDDAFALGMKGDVLRAEERFDEALPLLTKAVELAPDDAWNLGTRGQVFHALSQLPKARADLFAALRTTDDMPWIQAELAFVELDDDELTAALEHASAALERDPDEPIALLVMSELHKRGGDLAAAQEVLHVLTQAEPNLGWAWVRRAEVAADLDQLEEAQTFVHRALELDPHDTEAVQLGVDLLLKQGKHSDAMRLIQSLPDSDDTPPWVYAAKGAALRQAGDLEESIDTLRIALGAHPVDAELHFELARTMNQGGRARGALAEYRTAVALAGTDHFVIRRELADLEVRLKEYDAAAHTLEDGESSAGWTPDDLSRRGEALRLAGRTLEARRCFLHALEVGADPVTAKTGLLYSYLDLGKPAKARVYAQQVLEEAGQNPAILADVALVDAAENLYDAAVERTAEAMDIDSENTWVRLVRGRILNQIGDWQGAVAALELLQDDGNTASTHFELGWAAENLAMRQVADHVARGEPLQLREESLKLLHTAHTAYEQACGHDPDNAWFRRGLADVHSVEGADDLAREHYQAVVEKLRASPTFTPDSMGLLAWCHHALGDNATAISLYINAAATDTSDGAYLHFDLGVALLASDQPELAVSTYRRGLAVLDAMNRHQSLAAALVARNDLTAAQLLHRIKPDEHTRTVMKLLQARIASLASSAG